MKKQIIVVCALAMATGMGSANAGPGKDFLSRGIPVGDYKNYDKKVAQNFGKFHHPCKDWDDDHGCENPATEDGHKRHHYGDDHHGYDWFGAFLAPWNF